jgi:tRNA threonylcarbamoyladenosine biosynthesis protein TsaB
MLLAIDTATRVISLALHDGQGVPAEASWLTKNHHTVELAPAIVRMLGSVGLGVDGLTALAVARGPGSFMGLCIGLGVAKGLAVSRRLPLVAIPTLDIVAAAQPRKRGRLLAVLQAGRGRVCAQEYTWRWRQGAWRPRGELMLGSWKQLLARIERETLVSGEIDAAGREILSHTRRPVRVAPGAASLRRAGYLAEAAWARVRAGDTDDPFTVTPIYLH